MANFDGKFWDKNGITEKGKNLVRELNNEAPGIKRVRYEEHGPYIYAVKLKDPKIAIEVFNDDSTEKMEKMELIKVGFTHADTSQGNNDSRINTLMEDIKRKMKTNWKIEADCSVVFVLSIDALDTRGFFDVEADVRSKVGISVPKNIGKALHPPVHTEWVVTTKGFVSDIRNRIKSLKQIRTPGSQKQKQQTKQDKSPMSGNSTPLKKPESVDTPSNPSNSMPTNTLMCLYSREQEQKPNVDKMTDALQDMKLKEFRPIKTIDTEAIFGSNGLKFEPQNNGVLEVFKHIGEFKENEIDVKVGKLNDKSVLELRKSKKTTGEG